MELKEKSKIEMVLFFHFEGRYFASSYVNLLLQKINEYFLPINKAFITKYFLIYLRLRTFSVSCENNCPYHGKRYLNAIALKKLLMQNN